MDQDLFLTCLKDGSAAESLRLSCWDYGGQDTFYGLHHLYMGRNSVYVLVFNMEWFVQQRPGADSHRDFIAFWLSSIAVHTDDPSTGKAPIFLVGTHKDTVSSAEQHAEISAMLQEAFGRCSAWPYVKQYSEHDLCFFPVDNKQGSSDPVLSELKQALQEVVMNEKYVQTPVPFEWLKVLHQLHDEAGKGSSALRIDEVVEICRRCGMETSKTDASLKAMLNFFNDLGQLMYHAEGDMWEWVILDPANFLVTPASRIICQHDMHGNLNDFIKAANDAEPDLYQTLKQGVLDAKLLETLWSDRPNHSVVLQGLLVKYGFFVPLSNGEGKTVGQASSSRFLVPALLRQKVDAQSPASSPAWARKPKLVGYFIFGEQALLRRTREQGYVEVHQMKRDGFLLPMGLFPAVLGRVVENCQRVHDMRIDDMVLGMNEISSAFGKHNFSLRISEKVPALELVIYVETALLVAARVQGLIEDAAKRIMPSLQVALAVDVDGGVCRGDQVPEPQGCLVIVDGQHGLQAKVKEEHDSIAVGPGEKWSFSQAQDRFEKWLRPKGLREDGYDVMISYRWTKEPWGGIDSELVDDIFHKLCHELVGVRPVHVFVDRERLETGRDFKADFSQAVVTSTTLVLIVSKAALQKMITLQPESEDNVLLEWTIVAELKEIGALHYVVPVMIGDILDEAHKGSFSTNIFTDGEVNRLPDVACHKVLADAESLLRKHRFEPSPNLRHRTPRTTVNNILQGLGVLSWDVTAGHGGGAAAAAAASSAHTKADWRQRLLTEIVKKTVECLDKAEKAGQSKVGAQMPAHSQSEENLAAVQETGPASSTERDDLKALFARHGIPDLCERVCEELGLSAVSDLKLVVEEDVKSLDWLKTIPRKKLLQLVSDISSGSSPAAQSFLDNRVKASHPDVSKTRAKAGEPLDSQFTNQEQAEVTLQEAADLHLSMDEATREELLEEALQKGGKALMTSRINIVGEGRAGKTAWLRAISNLPFKVTDSTIGVQQQLLAVDKVDLRAKGAGAWTIVEDGSR